MSKALEVYCDQLGRTRDRLIETNISDPALNVCTAGLARVEEALRRPLRVVILGEPNSGKTSVADLFIGDRVLPTGVVSNTQVPVLIGYAKSAALYGIDRRGTRIRIDSDPDDPLTDLSYQALEVKLPLDRLRTYQVLDTPSSVSATLFVDDADIVIWCTVATRAWTESERSAWSGLPKRCMRNAILVATHKDSLQSDEDCAHVSNRLLQQTGGMFTKVLIVSARVSEETARASPDVVLSQEQFRAAIDEVGSAIFARRMHKADRIVRRLSRLTFHEFARREVRPDAVAVLEKWDAHARDVVEALEGGQIGIPAAIENLLASYAICAQKLRPGVVAGEVSPTKNGTAPASPARWPDRNAPAIRLVKIIASDLGGMLRILAGTSDYMHPARRTEIEAARSLLISLADLDGAFAALDRLIRT